MSKEQRASAFGFPERQFPRAKLVWSTIEKEAFAIVENCCNMDYSLQIPGVFQLFIEHKNLRYTFNPFGAHSDVHKYIDAIASKLQGWAMRLMNFQYTTNHIPGSEHV